MTITSHACNSAINESDSFNASFCAAVRFSIGVNDAPIHCSFTYDGACVCPTSRVCTVTDAFACAFMRDTNAFVNARDALPTVRALLSKCNIARIVDIVRSFARVV